MNAIHAPHHPMLNQPCVLLVEDHALFRVGMKLILESFPGMGRVLQAGSVVLAREHSAQPVDVILLDIHLPGLNGLDGLSILRRMFPTSKVIFVSASDARNVIREAIDKGADGFLPKSSSAQEILEGLHTVLAGRKCIPAYEDEAQASGFSNTLQRRAHLVSNLSSRQLEVLALLASGLSNKLIARAMNVAENTVRVHISAIYAHLNVSSRTAAVAAAQQAKLLGSA